VSESCALCPVSIRVDACVMRLHLRECPCGCVCVMKMVCLSKPNLSKPDIFEPPMEEMSSSCSYEPQILNKKNRNRDRKQEYGAVPTSRRSVDEKH